jgi:hypothetical protein
MSKLLQLNDMWKTAGGSGHGQELPSGVRESSYIENPDSHDDIRTRVGFIVATQVSRALCDSCAGFACGVQGELAYAVATQAAADEVLAKHGSAAPVAVLGEEPSERNIAQAMRALQVGDKGGKSSFYPTVKPFVLLLQEASNVPLRRIHFHVDLTPFVPSVTSPSPLQNTVADLFIRKVGPPP